MRELENEEMGSDKNVFFDRFDLSDKSGWLGFSEGNENFQKETKGAFDKKRVLGGCG